jgi:ribonuclease P protein component
VGPVTAVFVSDDGSHARVAYAVGRPVGGAVARNRLRRRLRAVVAQRPPRPGAYLVTVGRDAAGLGFDDLKTTVAKAMDSASRLEPAGSGGR